jgi:hypothetical protein
LAQESIAMNTPFDLSALDEYLHDAERMAWLRATWQSAELIDREMHGALVFKGAQPKARHDPVGRNALLTHAIDLTLQGPVYKQHRGATLFCEFGVHKGETITHIAGTLAERVVEGGAGGGDVRVHGFDSFEGLPDDWFLGRKAGRFSLEGNTPLVPATVTLHKGWFKDTLPGFVARHAGPAGLLHIDADLYSSAKTILDVMHEHGRIVAGTVIVFDEYFNYPGWQEHEYKAWKEFVARTGTKFSYVGYAPCHYSAAVRVE